MGKIQQKVISIKHNLKLFIIFFFSESQPQPQPPLSQPPVPQPPVHQPPQTQPKSKTVRPNPVAWQHRRTMNQAAHGNQYAGPAPYAPPGAESYAQPGAAPYAPPGAAPYYGYYGAPYRPKKSIKKRIEELEAQRDSGQNYY